jgi:hypothetical protein
MSIVQIKGFKCDRCGYTWKLRGERSEPKVCAKCHSAYWNEPRKRKKKDAIKGISGSRGSSVKQPVGRQPTRRTTPGRGSGFGTAVRTRAPVRRVPSKREIKNAGIGGAT